MSVEDILVLLMKLEKYCITIIGTYLNLFIPVLIYCTHIRSVHKLRLQNLAFFDHLPPSVYIFYGIKVDKKLIFFRPPTPSYCKRSLWTPPYVIYELSVRILIKMLAEFGGHQLKRASFSIFSTFLTRKKQMPSEFFKSTNRFLKVN